MSPPEDNLDALPGPGFLVDLDDFVVGWNSKAAALLGIPSESVVGQRFRDLETSYRVPNLRAALEETSGNPSDGRSWSS